MAMGFGAVVAYLVFEPSLCGGFAYFMNLKLIELFNVNVPWPVLALGMVALIAILTHLSHSRSAVLGVALVAEVVILIIFDRGTAPWGHGAVVDMAALEPASGLPGLPRA